MDTYLVILDTGPSSTRKRVKACEYTIDGRWVILRGGPSGDAIFSAEHVISIERT